jgi:predicted transcriptional regulator
VLALAQQGKTVREIARTTDVSEVAVRKHLRSLRDAGELTVEEGAA